MIVEIKKSAAKDIIKISEPFKTQIKQKIKQLSQYPDIANIKKPILFFIGAIIGAVSMTIGVGGSLIFKTAKLNGFSATAGLYTSQNPFGKMDEEYVGRLKAGKDTLARSDARDGKYGMTVLGQSYLQYNTGKTTIKFGRQLSTLFSQNLTTQK